MIVFFCRNMFVDDRKFYSVKKKKKFLIVSKAHNAILFSKRLTFFISKRKKKEKKIIQQIAKHRTFRTDSGEIKKEFIFNGSSKKMGK